MLRIILSLVLALAVCAGASARTFVLAAGVSNYSHPQNLQNNLAGCTKDVKRFKQVMQTQTNDITTLTSSYATAANIKEKLRAIANRAGAGDRIVFFYSGHGAPSALCVYDGLLPYTELLDILGSCAMPAPLPMPPPQATARAIAAHNGVIGAPGRCVRPARRFL